ncbi:DUF2812 domain-containing protein [Enterococcus sp. AZ192]|uniref:DUF2812 domain-containing protein n=1 Tax=unclassified Enterococcus TaxID=2608891 RepID=UPI003D26F3C5
MKMVRGKKYIFSRGVAFYPEKEMQILKMMAEDGWLFRKMNRLGFLVFEKGEPEQKNFSVDFFEGSKEELSEYLVIYEQAGWENIANYKNKYFYFKADLDTPTIYSDPESYWQRMKKEWLWMLRSYWIYFPIGLILLGILLHTKESNNLILSNLAFRVVLMFVGMLFVALPPGVVISVIFSLVFYRDRTKYYNHPERFAKRQKVMRDSLFLGAIGFVLGVMVSLILGETFY